jgi:hypothetical protein
MSFIQRVTLKADAKDPLEVENEYEEHEDAEKTKIPFRSRLYKLWMLLPLSLSQMLFATPPKGQSCVAVATGIISAFF